MSEPAVLIATAKVRPVGKTLLQPGRRTTIRSSPNFPASLVAISCLQVNTAMHGRSY